MKKTIVCILAFAIIFSFLSCGIKKEGSIYVYGTSAFEEKELKYSIYDAAERCVEYLREQKMINDSIWLQLDIIFGDNYIFKIKPFPYNLKLAEYDLSGIWFNGKTGDIQDVKKGGKVRVLLDYRSHRSFYYNIAKPRQENQNEQSAGKFALVPLQGFPIIDSTNFDNFEPMGKPKMNFLLKIKAFTKRDDISDIALNYRIPPPGKFTSLVLTYKLGEHELVTSWLTLDERNTIIDKLDIAYDEIAESAFRTTSFIDQDSIWVSHWNYMGDVPLEEKEIYFLQSNGKFEKVSPNTGK